MNALLVAVGGAAVVAMGFWLDKLSDGHVTRFRFGENHYYPHPYHSIPWAYWAVVATLFALYVLYTNNGYSWLGILAWALWLWRNAVVLHLAWTRKKDIYL